MSNIKSQMSNVKDVPWDSRLAWWGIVAVIGLNLIFLMVIGAMQNAIKFPAPIAIGIISTLLYGSILYLIYFFVKGRVDSLAFHKFPIGKALGYVFLFFLAILMFESFWTYVLRLVGVKPPDSAGPIIELFGTSIISFVAIFFLTVVVAPFAEEVFFRSFLYQAFRKRYGIYLGILISALIFGLFHFSFVVFPVFVVIGFFLGYIFEKYHSVYPAIMLHSLNNLFFFVVLVVTKS